MPTWIDLRLPGCARSYYTEARRETLSMRGAESAGLDIMGRLGVPGAVCDITSERPSGSVECFHRTIWPAAAAPSR